MDLPLNHDHLRPDGGTGGVLDPPPFDAVDDAALTPEALAENAPRLETVVQLLNRPALARIYVYVCYRGPVTPPAIMDALALSKSTTYEYIETLTELGLVEQDDSTRPQRLTAEPLIILEQYASIIVTPTVLHAIGLQEVDEDIAYFVERHGVGKLVAALRGAGLHFAGRTTQRMIASDIDVRDTEAMMIVYALRPALALGRKHDPYFAYLFPDVHDQLDLPEPDDEGGELERSPATDADE
jgi:predicted transcriptional regulator